MKKTIITMVALAFVTAPLLSQTTFTATPPEHTMFVTGMAEMEIIPDEIYVNVHLCEFTKDKKKYLIEDLEAAFLNFLDKTASTPKTDVQMDITDARVIAMKRKQKDAVIEKTYEVKFKDNTQVMLLFTAQDSLNLTNVYIKRYSHSKIDTYKQEVRANAMMDAKTKAGYMMSAISQKPGAAIYVSEIYPDVLVLDGIRDYDYYDRQYNNSYAITGGVSGQYGDIRGFRSLMQSSDESSGAQYDPVVKKIKLKYWVNVTFALA